MFLMQQQQQQQSIQQEPLELQIDYWPIVRPGEIKDKSQTKGTDQGKNSIKSTFRSLQVYFIDYITPYHISISIHMCCPFL